MRKLDERALVKSAIAGFIDFWADAKVVQGDRYSQWHKDRAQELRKLDPETATAEEVVRITDDPYANPCACSECDIETYELLEVGDGEALLCEKCLVAALELLRGSATHSR